MAHFPIAQSQAHRRVLLAFRLWSRLMRGHGSADRPDWLDTAVLNAVWLELPGQPGEGPPRLRAAVRDGLPLRTVPGNCLLPGLAEPLRLCGVRAPRAIAQVAPQLRPSSRPGKVGTATAVLRSVDGAQSFLLTCAHVAAPSLEGVFGEKIDVTHPTLVGRASLTDWRPAPSAGPEHSTIDAALLLIDDALTNDLRREGSLLPNAIGEGPRAEQSVSMRSHRGTFPGTLKVFWSGPVDVPGLTPGETDFFLDEAIGYRCASKGGDSGSAIWDERDRLMGMHLAGLDGAAADEANAVYGPIRPVLDTFRVSPWLRSGVVAPLDLSPAGVAPGAITRRGSAPPAGSSLLSEREVVACTLWGEARNQGAEGMRAVACVIANRLRTRYRNCTTAQAVCLDPFQFSCWLKNDPNQPRMLALARAPDGPYRQALAIADELLARNLNDISRSARHYYALSMRQPPTWARGKTPCIVIGEHKFFNDVA